MKIVAISGDRVYYRIGTDLKNSAWYKSDKVKDVIVQKGDEVELTFEKDSEGINILNSIKVLPKPPVENVATSNGSAPLGTQAKVWRQKSIDESEEIRRQAVGKMVAETIKAFDPFSNSSEGIAWLIRTVKDLYQTYDALTKG